MGIHHALEFAAHELRLGDVNGDPGTAACGGHARHVEAAALSRDHGREPPAVWFDCPVRAQKLAAPAVLEQLDPALDGFGGILGLDRTRIRLIGEAELARLVTRPHRRGDRRDQGVDGRAVIKMLLVAAGELGEFLFGAAHLAQPQDRSAADHLALRLDEVAGERSNRHGEAHAARAQRVEGMLHVARCLGLEPGAEVEQACARGGQERRIADDFGLVGRRRPCDQDLRLGQ